MLRWPYRNRGFTLLEIMMTVALLGIFLGIIYGFLNYNLRFLNQHNKEQDVNLQARTAMYRITYLLQQYQKLNVDYNQQNITSGLDKLVNWNINEPGSGYIYYYTGTDDSHIGQIKNSSGVVVDGVKVFNIEPVVGNSNLIKITIQVVSPDDPIGLTLSTELRTDRSYSP